MVEIKRFVGGERGGSQTQMVLFGEDPDQNEFSMKFFSLNSLILSRILNEF